MRPYTHMAVWNSREERREAFRPWMAACPWYFLTTAQRALVAEDRALPRVR